MLCKETEELMKQQIEITKQHIESTNQKKIVLEIYKEKVKLLELKMRRRFEFLFLLFYITYKNYNLFFMTFVCLQQVVQARLCYRFP